MTTTARLRDLELDRARTAPPDPASIMLIATALMGIGVTMIYSASSGLVRAEPAGDGHPLLGLLKNEGIRQLCFVPPALLAMWLASHIPHTFWRLRKRWYFSPSLILLLVTVGLLAAVLVAPASLAPARNGAKRWFLIPPASMNLTVQPSELGKLAMVIVLAALLADTRFNPKRFFLGLLPLLALVGLVVLPIITQDFGTAFLIAVVAGCVLLAGGIRIWELLMFIPPAAAAAASFILFGEHSKNRLDRIMTWWNGQADPRGSGYHVVQSLITIASGGWLGRGLGEGIQKLGYVPEDTTDFIFPVACEELGLVGAFIIIGLFIMLMWQLRRALASATDFLGQLIVLGVMLMIGFQAAMNIAVVTGAVPPKGIALPFVSYGGSGLVIMSVMLGLAASVARGAKREFAEE